MNDDLKAAPAEATPSSIKMNSANQPGTPEELKREQLLDALDTEIANVQSVMSATGRTRWALTLSVSGLLWLGLQTWEAGIFSLRNVILLAVALTFLWEFMLKVRGSLDSALLPPPARGRFITLNNVLGALRSTIVFHILKLSGLLAMIYWLALPELSLLKWCCVLNLALILICFVMSYVNMPPIPALDAPSKIRYMAWGREWLAWLCRIAIATSSVWVLYNYGAHFSAADLRLGIIITLIGKLDSVKLLLSLTQWQSNSKLGTLHCLMKK